MKIMCSIGWAPDSVESCCCPRLGAAHNRTLYLHFVLQLSVSAPCRLRFPASTGIYWALTATASGCSQANSLRWFGESFKFYKPLLHQCS